MFHRAHYNILANQIKSQLSEIQRLPINDPMDTALRSMADKTIWLFARNLAKRLEADNKLFDRDRFLTACKP